MTGVQLHPYIFFTGNCREAMEFYKTVLGGELVMMTYGETMGADAPNATHIMHAKLEGGVADIMASDGDRTEAYPDCRITISLSGDNGEVLTKTFNKLSEGGTVEQNLKMESWGDTFGMLQDKYGVDWMVNINAPKA